MKNPWKQISSRIAYENPWFKVREDQVEKPGNRTGVYGVVQTPPAVFIVALNSQEEIYLVGMFRYPTISMDWNYRRGDRIIKIRLRPRKESCLKRQG